MPTVHIRRIDFGHADGEHHRIGASDDQHRHGLSVASLGCRRSAAELPAPARTKSPVLTLRDVITPSYGAVIFVYCEHRGQALFFSFGDFHLGLAGVEIGLGLFDLGFGGDELRFFVFTAA